MGTNPAKDFDAIADDYAFFKRHSTETHEDIRAYQKHLTTVKQADRTVNMLDFGCGSGAFTAQFLDHAGWSPEQLSLTLVEPADAERRRAVAHLAPFTASPLVESAALPIDFDRRFDVVLANHVFYYVPDLQDTVARLISALSPSGVLLVAIEGGTCAITTLCRTGFNLVGRDYPYHTSEDFETALQGLNADYEKYRIPYELSFPDSEENRMRILRWVMAEHLAEMPQQLLVEWFDQFSRAGRIVVQTHSEHYTVRP